MSTEAVPKGYKRTEVGVIPEEWEAPLLDSIAKRGSGHTPDKQHPEYWNGDILWISLQDSNRLDKVLISDTAAKITPAGIVNSSACLHPAGTVVLSRDAGVGKSAIMAFEMAVSQHFMAWRCGQNLDNRFLYYWLQSNKLEFERIAMGNTIKTIGLPFFRNYKIALPALAEQQAITAALSDADSLIESLEQLLAKKRQIKQGAMQELLTGKHRLPGFSGKWENIDLIDFCTLQRGFDITEANRIHGNVPVYSSSGLSYYHNQAMVSPPGVVTGRKGILGKVFFIEEPFWPHDTTLWVKDFHRNDPKFVAIFLRNFHLEKLDAATSVPTLNRNNLAGYKITLPSLPEQSAIASVLSDMDAEIDAVEGKLEKARQVKQGMMQQLLTGKVRLV